MYMLKQNVCCLVVCLILRWYCGEWVIWGGEACGKDLVREYLIMGRLDYIIHFKPIYKLKPIHYIYIQYNRPHNTDGQQKEDKTKYHKTQSNQVHKQKRYAKQQKKGGITYSVMFASVLNNPVRATLCSKNVLLVQLSVARKYTIFTLGKNPWFNADLRYAYNMLTKITETFSKVVKFSKIHFSLKTKQKC